MTRIPNHRSAAQPCVFMRLIALTFVLAALLGAGTVASAQGLREGKEALDQGRVDDAVAAYRLAVQASPGDAQAHLGLAQALERKRSWQAAYDEFVKASQLDPRLAEPFRGQGATLLRLEKPAEAEAAFRKATDLDRKFPDAQLGLGEALVRQKKVADAIAVLEAGVKFGAKTAPLFYEGLGKAEAARDSMKSAEVWLLRAREAAPGTGRIHRSLGDLYMQRKIPTLAIVSYEEAKKLDASDLDTRMALGDAYYGATRYNDALDEYKAVVDADSAYAEGYYKLGNLYYLASGSDPQRVFSAIEVLEKLLQLDPNHRAGKAVLAQALYRKGGVEGKSRAQQLLAELEAGGPLPPEAHRLRGVLLYEAGNNEAAIDAFKKATRLDPLDRFRLADAYRRLASAEADTVKKDALYSTADSVYQRLIGEDSTTVDAKKAQLERAKIHYLRKNYASAIPQLQRTIALDPGSGEAYYYLGLSQRALGDDTNALASLKKSVELDPKKAGWWLQLGSIQDKLKDLSGAKEAFQRAADLDSSTTGAIALQQLGYKALLEKNHGAAIQNLEASTRRDPKQFMTWVWLGQARQNSGNKQGAIDAYRKALELKPGEPNATKGLKSLGV